MNKQALAGVNVLDFGQAIAGPLTTKHLADHGATVVRIGTATRPAANFVPMTAMAFDGQTNTSKYSMTLNLKHPRSREVTDRLIRWAHVVNENFTPGTMKQLGLDYESLCKIKPDIIMVSTSIFGQTGPDANQSGVDGIATAVSGRMFLNGWRDRGGLTPSAVPYGDAIHPFFTATAVMAALDYRRRTGKGQYIDAAMIEVCAQQIAPVFLDWQANSHLQTRNGNRVPNAAPHGVFPCIGHDRWCAITVFTDGEWQAFCGVIGNPAWTKDAKFAALSARKENEDELEKHVAEWTQYHYPYEIMHKMQAAGVPAGVVQNAADTMDYDPQLKEGALLAPLAHKDMGILGHPTPAYKLLKTKAEVRTFPIMGEHTEYVCTNLLGMSPEAFVKYSQEGVFK